MNNISFKKKEICQTVVMSLNAMYSHTIAWLMTGCTLIPQSQITEDQREGFLAREDSEHLQIFFLI